MRAAPITTDGEFIYMIATYKKRWSDFASRFVVEVYQLSDDNDLERIKEITLYKEDGTSHFIGSDRLWNEPEEGGYLNHCSTFTNGSMFALLGPKYYHTFDLNNGKRVGKNYLG